MLDIIPILKVLSNKHCLRIFAECEAWMQGKTNTHLEVGMSRKQYYTSLHKLMKADLIARVNGSYVQTLFGKRIAELIGEMQMIDPKKCKMMDVLLNSGEFSQEDIDTLVKH